jgi:hypothetical protein
MSAVISKYDDHFGGMNKQCLVCRSKIYRYPFLHWDEILICGECCRSIKRGFIADLIHVTAIIDLKKIAGYSDETFVRKTTKRIDEEGAKEQAAIEKIEDQMQECSTERSDRWKP